MASYAGKLHEAPCDSEEEKKVARRSSSRTRPWRCMISDRNGRLPPAGHETTDPAGWRDPGPVYSFEQRHNRQLLLARSCLPASQQLWAGVLDGPGETLQSLRADPPIFTTTKISIVDQPHAPLKCTHRRAAQRGRSAHERLACWNWSRMASPKLGYIAA